MKLSSPFKRRAVRKSAALISTLLLALPALVSAAPAPSVSGTQNNLSITDAATSAVFGGATVNEGSTNVLTVHVDFSPTNVGSLNLPAGVNLSGGIYLISTNSGAAATAILHTLVFTPSANVIPVPITSNVTFTVYVTDASGDTSSPDTSILHIQSLNDSPVLAVSGVTNIDDQSSGITPFQNATLTDPDNGGAQSQTITVTMNQTNSGYLSSATFASNNFVYSYTGTAAQAQTDLRALVFVPVPNVLPVGQIATNTFKIVDSDAIAAATNNSVRVLVLSVNDVPVLTGLPAGHVGAQTGGQNVSLLPQALLGDPDQNAVLANNNGENLTWSVTLSGSNPIGSLMLGGIDIGTTYATSGDPVAVTAALRSLAYHAPTLAIGGTNAMTLALTAADGHGGTVSSNVFIDVFSVVSPPGLTGTQSGQIVNDNTTIALFSKVGIQSFNGNFVTVQLALYGVTNDDQGQLFNLSSFTRATLPGATSLYSYTGTSEGATAAIRSILFQPTPNRIGGSTSETVTLGIRLIDGALTNNLDTSTSVIVVPVNDAPAIAGITPLTLITDSQTTNPFTGVLISDVDELGQQPVSAVVTLDDPAKGTLSVNNQTNTGFNGTNGIYFFSGTPAALTAAIRKLVFVPTPGRVPYGLSEITTFTISLNDNHGGIVANGATAVRVTPVNGLPVVTLPAPQPVSFPVGPNIFALQGVSIADATVLKVYITINTNAGVVGKFTTNSIAAAGFTALTNGSYFISGSASNVTAAVQLLDFSPATNFPPGSVTNYFVISATNSTLTPAGITVTHAVVLRTVPSSFIVTKLTDYDPSGSVADSLKAGTLRKAIAAAKNNDHITFDIRSTEAGQPDYPAVIRLVAPVALDKNLTFDGPGAERLSISGDTNANGTADVQLFTVNALVTMNRLTFTKGYAPDSGGAFEVNEFGALVLSYCAVTDCAADVWGGGVDVNQGSLVLDHCLVAGNRTSGTFGQGGGGVSYYTYWPCAILDTTFATNRQNAVGGLGGGAIYAETADSGTEFDLYVLNSTFRDNRDTAGHGSSFRPNVFNTIVQLQNTIVADGQGKNIEMDFSGALLSLGGNISDDATATIFSSGGAATNTFIFHSPADQVNVPATNVLAALANNGGPTLTYALSAGSPAIDNVISNFPGAAAYAALGTDQRGYFRSFSNNLPDIGAFERGAAQRVVIQELRVNPGANDVTNQFIEFYVPRDSTNVNFGGFQVLVDGVLRHTFANEWLQPGEALVLFSKDAANTGVPSVVHSQIAATNLLMNKFSGVVSLLNPAGQLVFAADYVGSFTATDTNDYGHLAVNYQSLVLSPSFQGVFLPYQRAVAKMGVTVIETNLSDPGHDPAGNLIGIGNAPPIAYADLTSTDAHTVLPAVNVLGNDYDPDVNDMLGVVAVGSTGNISGLTNYSVLGARLIINHSPFTGASISYDPTASAFLSSLPQGSNVVDSFQYLIIDSLNGTNHLRGDPTNALEIAQNLFKATATVTVNIVGVNAAPTPQPDSSTNNARLTTPEDVLLDFTTATNLLANDTDPNSDDNSNTLGIVSINDTNGYVSNRLSILTAFGATATLDLRFDRNETHITYDPRGSAFLNTLGLNQSTNDTFYYSVKDRYGVIGTSAVSILVTGVNDVPTANPDSFATDEDTSVTMAKATLLANDTDPDIGTTLSVTYVTPISALGASVSISGTNLIYNPAVSATLNALANKEFATDTFTYTATDEHGLSSNAVVTVTVAGVNDKPLSQADGYATDEETRFTTNAPGVLANDVEPDINGILPDDDFRVLPATNATPGGVTVLVNADGSFGYNPAGLFDWLKQGQTTNDAFPYVVMDHSLSIAGDDNFAVTASSTNNLLPVLANDAVLSLAGGAFIITSVTAPTNGGSVSINAAGNAIRYTPLAGYVGTETFSYAVSDGLGGGDTANVIITLTASSLYASADAFTVARGTTNSLDLLANDRVLPATGAAISITSLGAPDLGGTVSLNGTGPNNLVSYAPNPTNPCPFVESFSYAITSGTLVSTGVVSVTVLDRGNTLVANNDSFTVVASGGTTSFDVLANDLILPGPNTNLLITAFTSNSVLGTVSLNAAHTRLLYKPSNTVSNHQEPIITYTVGDSAGGSAKASVSVRVAPTGLIAGGDTFVVVKNSTNTLPVMVNDVILPNLGETLFISGLGIGTNAPSHGGTLAINGPGTGLIYAPPANFNGAEDFTYEITDGSPSRSLGHVHVVVLDNSPAASNPDIFRVDRDSADNVLRILTNDYTLPKTPGAFTLTGLQTNGIHATVVINGAAANNSLLYTPALGFIGTDHFGYEFTDTLGNKGTNSVSVTVGSLAPRADTFCVLSDSSTNLLDVLANDLAYPDTNSVRSIYRVGTPDHLGSAGANADGTMVNYTPKAGFTGTERFTYTLKDDSTNLFTATATVQVYARGSDRDTNTVTLTVIGVNDLPTWAGNANRAITDKQTVQPFSTIGLTDLDEYGLQLQTVRILMDHVDNATLQNLGGFTQTLPGSFVMSGTPAAIVTALRNIVFAPVLNHIPVPTTMTTHLTLSADDGYVLSPVTNLTTVDVTAVNDSPVISGTVAGQTVYNRGSIKPFAGVLINEVDNDRTQALRVTVTLDNAAKGGLSSLGGFTSLGSGVYSIGASNGNVTAAIMTAAMRGLVFTPTTSSRVLPGTTEATRFTIRVDDFFAQTVVDSNTTVVAIHPLTAKVTASDRTVNSQFGWSVATLRDLAVVGSPHDATGTGSGSAYLYARSLDGSNTWTQIKKLLPLSGHALDEFGTAVAISGDTVVVGARLRDDQGANSGAAYVFMRNQGGTDLWGLVKELLATDEASGDQFGTAVSISDDTVAVGSPLANASALANSGAVYIFGRNQGGSNEWGQVKKLVASGPATADHFGSSVSLSADTLVAGAPLVGGSGAAYVFMRNQGGTDLWGFVKKLVSGDGLSNGQFGTAASIAGDIIAISAPQVNASGLGDSGAVYVLTRNQGGTGQWGQVKRLFAADLATGDHFGSALAVNADALVVGAQLADGNGTDSGAAYLFTQNQGGSNLWGQVDKFLPSAIGSSDNFGSAVAISSGTVVVGAYNGLDSGFRYGTAFMFRIKYNNAPQVLIPLVNQTVTQNATLAYTVPAGTFADPDVNDALQLSLGASPVPPVWVLFDPLAGAFSGTPTVVGNYPVGVVAMDADGATATSQFTITVVAVQNLSASLSMGFQTIGAARVVVVSLNGAAGTGYKLQRTPSLAGNVIWTDVGTAVADGNGLITFQDLAAAGSMFYRAIAQ